MRNPVYDRPMVLHVVTGKVAIVWSMSPKAAQQLAAQLLERASDALNARKLARAKRPQKAKP